MKAAGARAARWWLASAPAERLAALRMLAGAYALVYVVARLGELMATARLPAAQLQPVGVVRVLGAGAPLPPAAATAIAIATAALLAAFAAGYRFRVTAPAAALGLLWVTSYRNSWGMVFHTENLMVLHVIALACAPAADAWSMDRARRGRAGAGAVPAPATGYGWPIKLLAALTAATYVLAGVAKLRIAGLAWIDGELLRNQIAIDNLRKALLGDWTAPLAIPFLDHPSAFTIFCALTLAIELGAFVALLGGRAARLWVLGAWSFHVGVVLLMNIWFPYALAGFAFFPVLRAERPFSWLIGRAAGRRGGGNNARGPSGNESLLPSKLRL